VTNRAGVSKIHLWKYTFRGLLASVIVIKGVGVMLSRTVLRFWHVVFPVRKSQAIDVPERGGDAPALDETTSLPLTSSMPLLARPDPDGDTATAVTGVDRDVVLALPEESALLVVQRGPTAGARYLLADERITVGRHPQSDIFLDDATVSRRHAEFLRQDGQFLVRDAAALNGTYVNRVRIDEAVLLRDGDEVQIGKYRLVFSSGRSAG
jgi:hypothetical protein